MKEKLNELKHKAMEIQELKDSIDFYFNDLTLEESVNQSKKLDQLNEEYDQLEQKFISTFSK